MATSLDEIRLGRDLVLPEDEDDDVLVTPTGDWPTVAGRTNLRAALRRRVCTEPGELLHRPGYGSGLPGLVDQAGTAAVRARMANDVRRDVLRDPRVAEAKARASAGLPGDETAAAVTLELTVSVAGDETADQMTIALAE